MTDRELLNELMKRMDRETTPPQPTSQRPRLGLMDKLMYLVCFVLAAVLLWALLIAPLLERVGLIAPPVQAATALPSVRPTMAPAQQYQAPPAPPQEVIAPAAPVIVVTPTYSTGCHEGAPYVDGIPTNGTCAGAAFVGEAATETALPTPTIAPATAVPPDAVYLETIRNQAPHCIRCAP